jgi:hypothetical protein
MTENEYLQVENLSSFRITANILRHLIADGIVTEEQLKELRKTVALLIEKYSGKIEID